MTQPTYSLGSEPPTTHLKNGKGRNTHCRQRLQTIGNTGLLSNSLSIKVFKIFYAFDIAIKLKDFYSDYGINLVAWAKFYLEYFYSSMVLWPPSHRIMIEEDGKKKYQYNLNVARNVFNIGSVLDKISEENGASEQLKKNKKVLVELMKEINTVHHMDEKEF